MNLLNIISNKELIGGMEISDFYIRFILLSKKDDKSSPEIKVLAEEALEKDTVIGGVIANEQKLVEKIKKMVGKLKFSYIILSISADYIYTKTFSFPAGMSDEKLENSISLMTNFQLPKKQEEVYLDWEKIDENNQANILLSLVDKTIIDKLIAVLQKCGLKIVAVEFHQLSIARVIKQKVDEPLLIIERGSNNTSFFVVKNNKFCFLRVLSNEELISNLGREINRIANYYEYKDKPIANLLLIGEFDSKEIQNLPIKPIKIAAVDVFKKQNISAEKYLISLGAALRGLVPRSEDNIISLAPVGTEEAFKREKMKTTISFLTTVTNVLSIFFIAVFVAVWLLVIKTQQNYNERIEINSSTPFSASAAELESKVASFNSLVSQAGNLVKEEPRWSILMEKIKSVFTPGIIINSINIPSAQSALSLNGTAKTRNDLNAFKKFLKSYDFFDNAAVPLDNLSKKNDIPFTATFTIKNQENLFIK